MHRRFPIRSLGLAAAFVAVAPPAAAQTAPAGQPLFKQRCQSCHADAAGAPSFLGPNLSGVVGRKAGSTSFAYSPALKSSGVVWTRPNLSQWLAGPAKMIPGSRMPVAVPDAAQRAAIIDYLATLH